MVSFLGAFKPVARFIPEVQMPKRRVPLVERLVWTASALAAYLIMCEVPLYGVMVGRDPFEATRVIFASRRGTLMELGIMPTVNAGLILQVLAGSGLISVDLSRSEDRSLFSIAMKVLASILTMVMSLSYIIAGTYGPLPFTAAAIVFAELMLTGLVIILLDELLQKGWGFGSGISLFILAGVCREIWWQCFGFDPRRGIAVGAILAFLQSLTAGDVWSSIYRGGTLPDMIGLASTVVVFLILVYLSNVRAELPISHAGIRGARGRFPIKLLYISVIPVIFSSMLFFSYINIVYLVWTRVTPHDSFLWDVVGRFEEGGMVPKAGLAYYLFAPRSLTDVMAHPVRASVYATLMVVSCAIFANLWIQIGGVGPADVARQLIDSGMFFPGFRRVYGIAERVLQRYIPTIALLGGIIVGVIAALSDFLGVFGSGTGILLAVEIVHQYHRILQRERAIEMYPGLVTVLGR
ncbi:MAG TPA: preprotein translocase subunit SecY [Candidatus Latescibacteria bacterium]|nr:preprotein translocase subunit SecY [Candidatus Latescibacterota bacterium]